MLFSIFVFGWTNWKTFKTPHFDIIYKPGYEKEATECLQCLEYYRNDVSLLTNRNIGKVPIVIEDIGSLTNGFANPLLQNIHIFTYPPSTASELGFAENWWRSVALHEYTHIGHTSNASGIPRLLTSFLGTLFQPNIYTPGWLLEGTAVLSESQFSPYEGRLNDGYFDAYIAARGAANKFPSLLDMTYLPFEYPLYTGRYMYGGKFFGYLKEKYGREWFYYLFEKQGSSLSSLFLGPLLPEYGIDDGARRAFANSFPALYYEWRNYELEKAKNWSIDGEQLTNQGWKNKFLICHKNQLYYVHEELKKTGAGKNFGFYKIVQLNITTQKTKTLVSLTSPVTCPLRILNGKLYYSVLDIKKGYANVSMNGFGFISVLHEKDLDSGKDRILLKDEIRAFTVFEDGKILYSKDQKHTFGSKIWLYSPTGKKSELMFKTDYLIGEIASAGEQIVVSARKDWKGWDLYSLDLQVETLIPLITTPFSEFQLSMINEKVFFTANYDKVYGIYTYDMNSKKFYRFTQGSYATYPAHDSINNNLYFIGLNANGANLYRKEAKFVNEFTPKNYPESFPPELSLDETQIHKGDYSDVLKTLLPAVHIPIVLPADTTFRNWFLWMWLLGGDATGEHTYSAVFANDPIEQGLLFFLSYQSLFFCPMISYIEFDYQNYGLIDLSYPIFSTLESGFSDLWLSFDGIVYGENFHRKALIPVVSTRLHYPTFVMATSFILPLERNLWGSNIYRNGFGFATSMRKYINNSEFDILFQGIYDPENPDSIEFSLRGYKHPFYTHAGGSISCEYSFPFLRIRKGFWNPNLYFEDIGMVLFTDLAIAQNGNTQFSSGIELQIETACFLRDDLRIIPKVGVSVNKEKAIAIHFGLDIKSQLAGSFSDASNLKSAMNQYQRSFVSKFINQPVGLLRDNIIP